MGAFDRQKREDRSYNSKVLSDAVESIVSTVKVFASHMFSDAAYGAVTCTRQNCDNLM